MKRKPKSDDTSLDWLLGEFRKHLHLPDPGALFALMGSIASNLMEGDPVWLMLVGPPSCGKTSLLDSLLSIKGVFDLASIKNESAFLSGTAKRERSQHATGGLLRQVGDHGAVVMNDFTSVLSLPRHELDAVLGVFRECYRGRWTRTIGAEGGREMVWEGRIAYFGGVTGRIDQHHEVSASLGERWIYYRMNMDEGASFEHARRALMNASKTGWKLELRTVVESFFAGLDLAFGELEKRRDLTDREMYRVVRMAKVGATCRSAVIRDNYTKEVISARETELEPRIATVLGQLLVGMERVGVEELDRWRILGKVTLDSMPRLRLLVISELKTAESVTPDRLVEVMGCSRTTVDRTVEDLQVHGIVQKVKSDGGRVRIELTEWMRREWQAGWTDKR